MTDEERRAFFRDVDAASRQAVWAALATLEDSSPRVRVVHPTWEDDVLWFATMSSSPKVRHIEANPHVDLQYQVSSPDFVHVIVRGRAEIVSSPDERARVWEVIDYDLSQFWPGGPTDPTYALVRITPDRVELSKTFGLEDRRVWRRF